MTNNEGTPSNEVLEVEKKIADLESALLHWQSILEDPTILGASKRMAAAKHTQIAAALEGARIQLQRLKMAVAA